MKTPISVIEAAKRKTGGNVKNCAQETSKGHSSKNLPENSNALECFKVQHLFDIISHQNIHPAYHAYHESYFLKIVTLINQLFSESISININQEQYATISISTSINVNVLMSLSIKKKIYVDLHKCRHKCSKSEKVGYSGPLTAHHHHKSCFPSSQNQQHVSECTHHHLKFFTHVSSLDPTGRQSVRRSVHKIDWFC